MDSSVSLKDQIWFLRMCYHVSNVLYLLYVLIVMEIRSKKFTHSAVIYDHVLNSL